MSEHGPADDEIGVLLVDDESAFVDAAATFVARHLDRSRTYTAESPAEAREFLREDPAAVDCIVSDYEMDAETGLDLLEAVRETRPDLPFILFTGKGSEEVVSEAFRAGATDYLKKELGTDQFEVLARRIEQSVTASRAMRAADRNRQLLDTAVDAMDDLFYVFDTSGQFLRWNDAFVEQTGYTDEEIATMRPTDFFGDADAERIDEAIAAVVDGEDVTIEAAVRTSDGETRPYEFTGSLLVDDDGDPFGICGIGRDRSNRAHIDGLEGILERLDVPVFAVGRDGTLEHVSESCDRLGIDADAIGEPAWSVLPWDADSAFARAVERVAETGSGEAVSVTLPDGRSAVATCTPCPTAGVRAYLTGLN